MGVVFNVTGEVKDSKIIDQCEHYRDYIDNHISNVQHSYENLFSSKRGTICFPGWNEDESNRIIDELGDDVILHDNSKYGLDEFDGYRRKWSATDEEAAEQDENILKMVDEAYQNAWYHHYTHNNHHPEFWKNVSIENSKEFGTPIDFTVTQTPLQNPLDMPIVPILHMICDWDAMSHKNPDKPTSTISWYINDAKKEKESMSETTRKTVEELLHMIYPNDPLITSLRGE